MANLSTPLIGLTTARLPNINGSPAYALPVPYSRSISSAGGAPILIPGNLSGPDLETLIERLDGIVFTGGYDVDPRLYGSQLHSLAENIDAERDQLECRLVRASIESGKAFLGICRGLQVINVALGGTLYEDLPSQFAGNVHLENHDKPRDYLAHTVAIEKDTRLAQILGSNPTQVNSLHHQGIRRLAGDLHPAAYAPDGLVEAFELPASPFGLAVQWHPEELQEDPDMRHLFQVFIHACQEANADLTQRR